MTKTKKRPELRFRGFTKEWEERKFSKTFSYIPNNTLSRAELNFDRGLAKNVHYGDVLIKFGELLDVQNDQIPYITKDVLVNRFRSSELQNGDVIIADTAEDEAVGKCTELVNMSKEIIFSGLHTIPSRPILHFSSGYLGFFMNSPAYHDQLLRLMQGTKVSSISKTTLRNTDILYPIDSVEQTRISSFFQNLDSLIALHQRKYDKICTVKKSMLEKMFPREGADVPEIRFKGFTGKWESRKIGEILTERKRPIDLEDSRQYELVTVKRRNEGVVSRGMLKGKDILVKNYYEIRAGDYVISKRQIVHGANGIVPQNLDKAIVSNEYLVAVGNNNITTDFWTVISKLPDMYKKFFLSSYGVDIEKLVFDVEDWKKRNIEIPTVDEQNRITAFFKNLDALIFLHQRELDKLKNIKKACLEKMFI
jgi:type I restriction enzyme S subunit